MTQKEKQLLLKDICARLPYGVKCNALLKQIDGSLKSIFGTFKGYNEWASIGNNLVDIETVKPYLRPLSSMTKEEEKELDNYVAAIMFASQNKNPLFQLTREAFLGDFFNKRHFDYRGLIEEGLALEASEDMYKIK